MNLYICGINLYIFKIFVNKCIAIFIIMHSVSQIGGEQQNMKQFQIMSLEQHAQIGPLYEEIWPAGWQVQNRYLKI